MVKFTECAHDKINRKEFLMPKLQQPAKGRIIGTDNVHLEELIPVDTNEPTDYVKKWDCGRTEDDKVTAYLTGTSSDYSLHIYGSGKMKNYMQVGSSVRPEWEGYAVKHIIIHDGITEVGNFAFAGSVIGKSLQTISLPDTLRIISVSAFEISNSSVSSVTITSGTRDIKVNAFYGMSGVSSVSIPESVRYIDNNVFRKTQWFEQQTQSPVIVGDGVLLKDNMSTANRVIPSGVKFVAQLDPTNAKNRLITSLTIPDNVRGFGRFALDYITSLTSLTLPDSIRRLGTACFRGFAGTTLRIPSHLKRIPSRMLLEAHNLSHIYIPATVEEIWSWEHGDNYAEVGAFANGAPFYNTNENLHIYCERAEKPSGWDDYWDYVSTTQRATVHWGVSKAAYDAQVNEGGE